MSRSLTIVVPVFDEEASIDAFYERIDALGLADALLFVDNASTDGTVAKIQAKIQARPLARLIRHVRNEGYSASIRDGLVAAGTDDVVVIDVDLEYPPEIIPTLVAELERHPVVYASRFLGRTPDMSPVRRIGNRAVTALFDVLFGQSTTDLYTGCKALRRDAFPLEQLRLDGFDGVVELAVLVATRGARIHDVPIVYAPRSRDRSKMRHVPEALRCIAAIVRFWLRCVVLGRPLHPASGEGPPEGVGPGRDDAGGRG